MWYDFKISAAIMKFSNYTVACKKVANNKRNDDDFHGLKGAIFLPAVGFY